MMKSQLAIVAVLFLTACNQSGSSKPGTALDAALIQPDTAGPSSEGQAGTGGVAGAGGATIGAGGATDAASGSGGAGAGGNPEVGGTSGGAGGSGSGGTEVGESSQVGGTRGGSGGSGSGGATLASDGSAGTTSAAGTGGRDGVGGQMSPSGGARAGGSGGVGSGGAGGVPSTGGTAASPGAGAPEPKPLGYGQATTGGGSAAVTDVATMAALQAAIDAYAGSGGLSLRYTGKFDFSTIPDPCTQWNLAAQIVEIKKKSDITLMGADGSAANFGVHVASSSSNIIVRNMTFGLLPGGGSADAISLEGMSGGVPANIWIDHNTLFSSMAECAGAGDSSFDGLIDVKKGADNVTVSYNYLHDHHKVSLNGYSDSDTAVRHITFHHNVFENVGSRTPLQRGGYSHILGNYFTGITTSGINVRMGGNSLIESNYFDSAQNPVTSRDSSAIGYWELRNNNIMSPADFAKFGITWEVSSSTPTKDATDWTTTAVYPVAIGYTYSVDPPQCLKDGLRAVAGAGTGLATLRCN